MSGLSEEQRRRMEENRQRALQKRLKLQATSNTDNKTSQPFHSATTTNPHNVLEGPNILRPSNVIPEGSVFSNISRPSHFPKVIPEGSNISRPSNSPNFIPDDQVILKPSNPMSSNFSKHSNDVVVGALHCTDIARGPVTSYDTSITKTRQHSASSNTSPCDTNLIMKQPNSTIYELLSSGISNNFPRPPISKQLLHSSNLPKANTGFQPPGSKRSPPLDTKSEDARKRIEENRRRALERRAASKGITAIPNAEAPFSAKPATSFYSTGQTKTSNDSMRRGTDLVKPSSDNLGENMGRMKPVMGPSGVLDSPGRKTTDAGNAQGTTKAIFGRTINGTFRLTCPERFIVDAPFHHQMVEIFKTLDTKMYDPMTQKWNFSVKEHDKLVSALAPLRPAVCISPLPAFVRKVLQSSEKQVPASCIDLFGLDPKLLEALMPFQHDGVCFGVSRGGRVLIADDMGLGKTIQALGVAVYYRSEWPLLVVTPSSVRYSWASSVERWVGSVERHEIVVVRNSKDYFAEATVVIMSYDLLARREKEALNRRFRVVIMDESHMIKNFKTARYKAAAQIIKEAKRVLLLSGTPALSRPSELYTQINSIDPKIFPSYQDYGVRYCGGKQTKWGWDFSGSSNMQELKILLEAKFMIRRLKSQVLDQLPAKQRMTVILDPTAVESGNKAMEESVRKLGLKSVTGASRQTALLQYFAQTAHSKLKAVGVYVKELLESDEKFLVFAHHQVMLDMLCEVCDKANTRYIRIDGKTNGELRQNYINAFQTKDEVKVAILSLTAANTGITLTAAHLVVFAELFWNPGVLVQAEDRTHRIGQEDCVVVQYLVGKGTADDFIWPLVQAKLDVLGSAGLTKDNFSDTTSTYQKGIEQNTITQYLLEMQDLDHSSDPTTTTTTKRPRT